MRSSIVASALLWGTTPTRTRPIAPPVDNATVNALGRVLLDLADDAEESFDIDRSGLGTRTGRGLSGLARL